MLRLFEYLVFGDRILPVEHAFELYSRKIMLVFTDVQWQKVIAKYGSNVSEAVHRTGAEYIKLVDGNRWWIYNWRERSRLYGLYSYSGQEEEIG